jgi:hypothetical protein
MENAIGRAEIGNQRRIPLEKCTMPDLPDQAVIISDIWILITTKNSSQKKQTNIGKMLTFMSVLEHATGQSDIRTFLEQIFI